MNLKVRESTGHGKTVKGCKRTSTIQIIEPMQSGYLLKKSFRFVVGDPASRLAALEKAAAFIEGAESTKTPL